MKNIYRKIGEQFDAGNPVIIATVVKGQGSTPRKPGAKMVFFKDGSNIGTVGGGPLEAAVQNLTEKMWIRENAVIKSFYLRNNIAGGLGMVCGGDQQILMAWLSPDPSHQEIIQRLVQPENPQGSRYLVTRLQKEGTGYIHARLGLFDNESVQLGMQENDGVIESLRAGCQRKGLYLTEKPGDVSFFVEKVNHRQTLYLFGAGHVARPIVEIASLVGFRTVVLDDREHFANRSNFPRADKVTVLRDFDSALEGLSFSGDSYVVIVTRGHAHDQVVLEQVLTTSAVYVGMIGSSSKVAHCFQSLLSKGLAQDKLDRVYAPIGMEIGSETPEEIAVSIVAQLVHVRSQLRVK